MEEVVKNDPVKQGGVLKRCKFEVSKTEIRWKRCHKDDPNKKKGVQRCKIGKWKRL